MEPIQRTMQILDMMVENSDEKETEKLDASIQEAVFIFNGVDIAQPVCEECLKNCDEIQVDDGIGDYEFHGEKGSDVKIVTVSNCCQGDLL